MAAAAGADADTDSSCEDEDADYDAQTLQGHLRVSSLISQPLGMNTKVPVAFVSDASITPHGMVLHAHCLYE